MIRGSEGIRSSKLTFFRISPDNTYRLYSIINLKRYSGQTIENNSRSKFDRSWIKETYVFDFTTAALHIENHYL